MSSIEVSNTTRSCLTSLHGSVLTDVWAAMLERASGELSAVALVFEGDRYVLIEPEAREICVADLETEMFVPDASCGVNLAEMYGRTRRPPTWESLARTSCGELTAVRIIQRHERFADRATGAELDCVTYDHGLLFRFAAGVIAIRNAESIPTMMKISFDEGTKLTADEAEKPLTWMR
jgi:hypothetical protein